MIIIVRLVFKKGWKSLWYFLVYLEELKKLIIKTNSAEERKLFVNLKRRIFCLITKKLNIISINYVKYK
jgi:hypothetical protein